MELGCPRSLENNFQGATVAEPTVTTTAGISLTTIAVALLGPLAGPYAVIVFAALAGAMWPLSASTTPGRMAGAWLLLRCTLMAVICTGVLASLLERWMHVPVNEGLAPVALVIGALGNGWRPVFEAVGSAMSALAGRAGAQKP